ncbi:MAG: dienelactone hydrolase family protein [Acidobacteriota bacterium]
MPIELFLPNAAGRRPACLILHGTSGLVRQHRASIVLFAEALAENGVVAAVPHYLASTGTAAGLPAMRAMHAALPEWRAACRAALLFTQQHARVDASRIGLLGFSLGGHLALSLGMAPPADASVKCVVDFFGPTIEPLLIGNRSLLPPVLIHHGTADRTVTILNSERLVAQLMGTGKTRGREYEYLTYPGQKHGFAGGALERSRSTTVEFMTATL